MGIRDAMGWATVWRLQLHLVRCAIAILIKVEVEVDPGSEPLVSGVWCLMSGVCCLDRMYVRARAKTRKDCAQRTRTVRFGCIQIQIWART